MFQQDFLPPVKRSAKQIFLQLKNKLKVNESYQYSSRQSKNTLGVNLQDLDSRIQVTRNKFQ